MRDSVFRDPFRRRKNSIEVTSVARETDAKLQSLLEMTYFALFSIFPSHAFRIIVVVRQKV